MANDFSRFEQDDLKSDSRTIDTSASLREIARHLSARTAGSADGKDSYFHDLTRPLGSSQLAPASSCSHTQWGSNSMNNGHWISSKLKAL